LAALSGPLHAVLCSRTVAAMASMARAERTGIEAAAAAHAEDSFTPHVSDA